MNLLIRSGLVLLIVACVGCTGKLGYQKVKHTGSADSGTSSAKSSGATYSSPPITETKKASSGSDASASEDSGGGEHRMLTEEDYKRIGIKETGSN